MGTMRDKKGQGETRRDKEGLGGTSLVTRRDKGGQALSQGGTRRPPRAVAGAAVFTPSLAANNFGR